MINVGFGKKESSDPARMNNGPITNKLDVIIHQPLQQVDICAAISYFGVTELLDTIGVAEIERYLADRSVSVWKRRL